MKKLFVILASSALLLAGFLPLTSASNPQDSFSLNMNMLSGKNSLTSQTIMTLPSQEGDLSTLVGSGQATTESGVAEPHEVIVQDTIEVPKLTNKQIRERQGSGEEQRARPIIPIAEGPTARAGVISPATDAPLDVIPAESERVTSPQAPNDMVVFRQHDMTNTEAPISERSNILEPTAISVGNAVFYTSNWFAARSVDGGQTFTYINPYAVFPSINNGFCCDQVTAYAPNQNMAIWGLQYSKDATGGTLRIARTIGSEGIGSNSWVYYNFNPQMFGFAATTWMDFPNMTVGATYLYLASNVFTQADVFAGNVVWRLPLASFAAGGAIPFLYLSRSDIRTIRLADGSTTTMYWAAFLNTTTMRIHRWDDTSGVINWDDIALNAFTYLNRDGVSMTADGRNWANRGDSRPLGAYVAKGIIGVLWMACQDATFPQPYTIHARFNQGTRALITQQQIWNPTFAWLYPNVSVNAAGNLGGVIAYGGGTGAAVPAYPHAAYWVVDDVQPGLPMGGSYAGIIGNAGPVGNAWGDYLSVRRHSLYPNTWVAAVYALNGTTSVPRYLWFGRQRDLSARIGDYDGDAQSDYAVVRNVGGTLNWYIQRSALGFVGSAFGSTNDTLVPGDYDGDLKWDVAVWRSGTFYIFRSATGTVQIVPFGAAGDDARVTQDYDGDGRADPAVTRSVGGGLTFYILRSTLGFTGVTFGAAATDVGIRGDWDGDGKADVAVYRSAGSSPGTFYVLRSSDGGVQAATFGVYSSDWILPADFDNDGKTDYAVYRFGVGGLGTWYWLQSSDGGFRALTFGTSTDLPVPGDYDGDGRTDQAVWRGTAPSTFYVNRSTSGFVGFGFGVPNDTPPLFSLQAR